MIKDNIQKAENYYNLSDGIKTGLEYLQNTNFSNIENGKYEISENVFANVQEYVSKPEEEGRFEAHEKYIDIQYIVKGEEKIGVCNIANFFEETPYNEEKDIVFLKEKNSNKSEFFHLKEEEFMILYPQDAHMPSIAAEKESYVKKVVIKVHI